MYLYPLFSFFFFFNDTATTEIYTLSLHDALPICDVRPDLPAILEVVGLAGLTKLGDRQGCGVRRSEEHTSELQSHLNLVCRLLLEKKKKQRITTSHEVYPSVPPLRALNGERSTAS